MPNALLARYFTAKELLSELDFEQLSDTKPDDLMVAWNALDRREREQAEADFRVIFDLSCEGGARAIVDEANWHLEDDIVARTFFVREFSKLASHYERAMVAFLDHYRLWRGATQFYHADTLPYWRKRKNLPHVPAAVDVESREQLATLIRTYFHEYEGRGNHCVVDALRRGDLDYFFAYPEDYSQQSVEWVGDEFDRRAHNPAFEVVFVYSQREGSLDVNLPGVKKAIEPLQEMFANAVLKLPELPSDVDDSRVYDLNVLRDRYFEFVYDPIGGIQRVGVKKLRLSSRTKAGDRITVEADAKPDLKAIYPSLEKLDQAYPRSLYNVTQAELAVTIVPEAGERAKTVTVRLTYPNSCSAKYDEMGLKIRTMLADSGIEPRRPEHEEELLAEVVDTRA